MATTRTPNEQLLDGQIAHAISIERYKAGEVKRVLTLLNKAEADLEAQITRRLIKIEQRGYDLGKDTTARLDTLLKQIRDQRKALYDSLYADLSDEMILLAASEVDFQVNLMNAAASVDLELATPTAKRLQAIVRSQPMQGAVLREWVSTLERDDVKRISDTIKVGIVQGKTTDEIVRGITGTKKLQYSDGVIAISRRDAAAVVRTAITHTANRAREEMWAENAEIIEGVQWLSTLDGRTSAVCRVNDGKVFEVNKGPRPPAHFNCRSIMVAYFGPEFIVGSRASVNGPVPADLTYSDWLKRQPAAVQDDILGKTKGKLFRDGGMTLDKFVDSQGKELNLDQLKMRDRAAFKEAGIE